MWALALTGEDFLGSSPVHQLNTASYILPAERAPFPHQLIAGTTPAELGSKPPPLPPPAAAAEVAPPTALATAAAAAAPGIAEIVSKQKQPPLSGTIGGAPTGSGAHKAVVTAAAEAAAAPSGSRVLMERFLQQQQPQQPQGQHQQQPLQQQQNLGASSPQHHGLDTKQEGPPQQQHQQVLSAGAIQQAAAVAAAAAAGSKGLPALVASQLQKLAQAEGLSKQEMKQALQALLRQCDEGETEGQAAAAPPAADAVATSTRSAAAASTVDCRGSNSLGKAGAERGLAGASAADVQGIPGAAAAVEGVSAPAVAAAAGPMSSDLPATTLRVATPTAGDSQLLSDNSMSLSGGSPILRMLRSSSTSQPWGGPPSTGAAWAGCDSTPTSPAAPASAATAERTAAATASGRAAAGGSGGGGGDALNTHLPPATGAPAAPGSTSSSSSFGVGTSSTVSSSRGIVEKEKGGLIAAVAAVPQIGTAAPRDGAGAAPAPSKGLFMEGSSSSARGAGAGAGDGGGGGATLEEVRALLANLCSLEPLERSASNSSSRANSSGFAHSLSGKVYKPQLPQQNWPQQQQGLVQNRPQQQQEEPHWQGLGLPSSSSSNHPLSLQQQQQQQQQPQELYDKHHASHVTDSTVHGSSYQGSTIMGWISPKGSNSLLGGSSPFSSGYGGSPPGASPTGGSPKGLGSDGSLPLQGFGVSAATPGPFSDQLLMMQQQQQHQQHVGVVDAKLQGSAGKGGRSGSLVGGQSQELLLPPQFLQQQQQEQYHQRQQQQHYHQRQQQQLGSQIPGTYPSGPGSSSSSSIASQPPGLAMYPMRQQQQGMHQQQQPQPQHQRHLLPSLVPEPPPPPVRPLVRSLEMAMSGGLTSLPHFGPVSPAEAEGMQGYGLDWQQQQQQLLAGGSPPEHGELWQGLGGGSPSSGASPPRARPLPLHANPALGLEVGQGLGGGSPVMLGLGGGSPALLGLGAMSPSLFAAAGASPPPLSLAGGSPPNFSLLEGMGQDDGTVTSFGHSSAAVAARAATAAVAAVAAADTGSGGGGLGLGFGGSPPGSLLGAGGVPAGESVGWLSAMEPSGGLQSAAPGSFGGSPGGSPGHRGEVPALGLGLYTTHIQQQLQQQQQHQQQQQSSAGPGVFSCSVCGVTCNSTQTLEQHLSSRKHMLRMAHVAAGPAMQAARELQLTTGSSSTPGVTATALSAAVGGSSGLERAASPFGGGSSGGSPRAVTYVGPNATLAEYCNQEISPQLNQAVTTLLQQVKGYQDRAMAKNSVKVRGWASRLHQFLSISCAVTSLIDHLMALIQVEELDSFHSGQCLWFGVMLVRVHVSTKQVETSFHS